jgi:hypothetical protein
MPASNSFPLWSENLVPGGQQSPVRLRSRQKMTLLQKAPQNRAPNRWTTFVCLVVVVLLFSGCDDRKPKVYRVGILSGVEAFAGVADGFRSKMAELGYIEGQNILYDVEKLNADPVGEKRVARKFVTDKVDMIFAFPTEPAVAAKEATQGTNIPVVFANAGLEGTNLTSTTSLKPFWGIPKSFSWRGTLTTPIAQSSEKLKEQSRGQAISLNSSLPSAARWKAKPSRWI